MDGCIPAPLFQRCLFKIHFARGSYATRSTLIWGVGVQSSFPCAPLVVNFFSRRLPICILRRLLFLFLNALVRLSTGPLIRWSACSSAVRCSARPLVQRFLGPMQFHWSAGLVIRSRALVNWSVPSLLRWSADPLICESAGPFGRVHLHCCAQCVRNP